MKEGSSTQNYSIHWRGRDWSLVNNKDHELGSGVIRVLWLLFGREVGLVVAAEAPVAHPGAEALGLVVPLDLLHSLRGLICQSRGVVRIERREHQRSTSRSKHQALEESHCSRARVHNKERVSASSRSSGRNAAVVESRRAYHAQA